MSREAFEKAYHKETGLYASYAPNKKGYTDVIAGMCYRIWQAALQSGEPVVDADAKREAESFAMSLWQKWYKDDSPNFELCDSVAGVITQINNMTAGLVREDVSWGVDWGRSGDRSCVSICKSFPDGSLEIVATEFSPYTAPQPMVPEGWKIHKKDSAFTLTHPDGTELKFGYSNGGIMTHMLIELCEALLSAGKGGEV